MKYYSIKILIRLVLLTIVITLTLLAFMDDRIIINRFILLVLFGISAGELFWFLHYTSRQLTLFVQSLKNEDYTIRFPFKEGKGGIHQLNKSFQEVILQAREKRSGQESHHQFLEMAFDRLNAGILSISPDDEVYQMNRKAGDLLGTGRIHSLLALEKVHPSLVKQIRAVGDEHDSIFELLIRNRPVSLSLRSTRLKMDDVEFQLVVFHDIREALDAKEIESWTRLIRILTHEIMNSVTPIASLSESMHSQLLQDGKIKAINDITPSQLEDLTYSLQTINRRSEGLLVFVENYRQLTRVGKPSVQSLDPREFIGRLLSLFSQELKAKNIRTELDFVNTRPIEADPVLGEQALINVLKNAIEALENTANPQIRIELREENGFHCLKIEDNGEGISREELKEVFVPFFTTKNSGSGIGLSLSRQILHAHGGTIRLESDVNKGTICSIFIPFNN